MLTCVAPGKKTKQVGFKMTPELYGALERAAFAERRGPNELARMIFEWAFEEYKQAGSYFALIDSHPEQKKRGRA